VLAAQTDAGLFLHAADGAWESAPLPATGGPGATGGPAAIAVHPADPAVLYAAGREGLYKSRDGGAAWAVALPTDRRVLRVAVGPADPELVYLALSGPPISADFWFLRSRDGGTTWEQLEEAHNSLCGWGVRLLVPHPADVGRAFRTAGCYAGRDTSDGLDDTRDAGATWSALFRPELAFPERLVVVPPTAAAPGRFYLGANRDVRAGGSSVFRSDDDGRTWAEILALRGGGTLLGPAGPTVPPNVVLGGLAADPRAPNRVFVALNETRGAPGGPLQVTSRVRASADGGASWTDLGSRDLGTVVDLALEARGRTLYAASDRGLWRLSLPEA
jgi:hypothetical protein